MSQACTTCNGIGWLGAAFDEACPDCAPPKGEERGPQHEPLPTAAEVRVQPQRVAVTSVDGGPISPGEGVDAYAAGFTPEQVERSAR